jgi:hypothetical protein
MFTQTVSSAIDSGLKIDPNNREVTKVLRFYRGFANYKNNRFKEAIDDFTQALILDQTSLGLFMLRAKCFIQRALYDDAIIDLLEAEKLNDCTQMASEIKDMRRKIGSLYIPKTNYEFLEVSRTATDNEIVLSFNSLTLLHKVNLSKAKTDAEKRMLEFKYKRVANAFAIVTDKKLKKKYDKILAKQEASIECPTVRICCASIGSCFTGCCSSTGSCFADLFGGVGNCCDSTFGGIGKCFSGFGECLGSTVCSQEGCQIFCNSMRCGNIIVALIIFGILFWIFH